MTIATRYRKSAAAPLKTYNVNLWPLEGCELQCKARTPSDARRIAARVWGGDDITAVFAEPDYWTIDEILAGTA
jgi:hypothetical protein